MNMDDKELDEILHEWRAPKAPPDLEARVWAAKSPFLPGPGLRWLLTGSIRVPVPAVILVLIAAALLFFSVRKPAPPVANRLGLAGFQPVQQLKPRVVGRNYEVQ
jgi:hypothetical protein